ncbi:hypothetical protein ACWGLP_36160 [Streptomyces lydicus]
MRGRAWACACALTARTLSSPTSVATRNQLSYGPAPPSIRRVVPAVAEALSRAARAARGAGRCGAAGVRATSRPVAVSS